MDIVRITELQPKTYVEQGDYIAIDNQSDGTKKVQFTNLLDDTLSQENKIAPANVVGDEIATIRAAVGSPLKASTVAQMTDTNKIYVYVGSESGYTNGNWYYWNGSAWTSGGVYNSVAVVTDPTLTLSGVPADAKATGDEVTNLKSAISDLLVGDYIFIDGFTISSVGKWHVDNDCSAFLFPVSPSDVISIKSGIYAAWYTFLKSYSTPVAGELLDFATGYSQWAIKGGKFSVTTPNDAKYLLIGNTHDGTNILPLWAKNKNYDYVLNSVKNYNNVANNVIEISTYPTSGYVTTQGQIATGGTWVTTDYYPAEYIKSIYLRAYQIPNTVAIASFYDKDKNFIYSIDTVSGTSGSGGKDGYLNLSSVPSTAKYVRFSTNDSSHFVVMDYDISRMVIKNNIMANDAENNKIDSDVKIVSFNSDGYINMSGGISSGSNWVYTDYMSATDVRSIKSKAYQFPNTVALVAFYDINKEFISAVDTFDGQTGSGVKEGSISTTQIPNNAVFMRFSSYASTADKYVSVAYDYTSALHKTINVVPQLQSEVNSLERMSNGLYGYPFRMTFIGDSLTYGQTYVHAQGTPGYAYKNKANYPDAFCRMMDINSKTVIAVPGASSSDVWSDKKTEIEAVQNQFVIVWLGTNGGLTDTVDSDCVGDDVDSYANTNTGNYGKVIKTLTDNGNKVFLAQLCYTSQLTSNPVIAKLANRFDCSVIELTPDDIEDLNQDKYHTAYNGYVNSVHFNSIGYNHVASVFFSKMMGLIYATPEDYEILIEDV